MKLSSNIMRFYHVFGLKKTIDIFAEAGFDGIDFNSDLQEYCDDTHSEDFYKEMGEYVRSKGLFISQAHAPFASSFEDESKTKKRFSEIVKGMKHSALIGAPMIVVHPCQHLVYTEGNNAELLFEYNVDFYKKLIPYSEEYGIKIAIENIIQSGAHSVCSTAERLAGLYDELNNDAFVVCFDVGHMNILGDDPTEAIRTLGKRIKCTHVHDNDGVADCHTLPYYGTIDWENIMKAFADIDYSGDLSYEAGLFVANAPKEIMPTAAKYMAKTGRHLIDRFDYYRKSAK